MLPCSEKVTKVLKLVDWYILRKAVECMQKKKGLRFIFWLETVLALLTTVLFVVTLISNDWIELVFHVDPDGGNGSFEKVIVGVLLVVTLALFSLAGFEWRRTRAAVA